MLVSELVPTDVLVSLSYSLRHIFCSQVYVGLVVSRASHLLCGISWSISATLFAGFCIHLFCALGY